LNKNRITQHYYVYLTYMGTLRSMYLVNADRNTLNQFIYKYKYISESAVINNTIQIKYMHNMN